MFKSIKRIVVLSAILLSIGLVASVAYPQQAKTNEVAVKDSAASQALNQIAKDEAVDQKVFQTKLQQARFNLDATSKALNEQILGLQKELQDKINGDKKYKPMLDQITDLQKKLKSAQDDANAAFLKDTQEIQGKLKMESDQANGLIPVVRKENNLPDGASYNIETQKWTVTSAKKVDGVGFDAMPDKDGKCPANMDKYADANGGPEVCMLKDRAKAEKK